MIIQEYINNSEFGDKLDVRTMRNDLAIEFNADFTCPMTTGIFLKIVAEYNYENLNKKKKSKIFLENYYPNVSDRLTFDKKIIINKRNEKFNVNSN